MLDFGFYNMDCMIGMKEFPDKFFDLAVVDPPYGIGIGHTVKPDMGGAERHPGALIHAYGESTKALASQNFIIRSMIARHRTGNTLMSLSGYQKRRLFGAAISFWMCWARQAA